MFGWMGALWTLAAVTLAALPLVRVVARPAPAAAAPRRLARGADASHSGRHGQPQLSAAPRRLLHVRFSHRVSGDPSTGRSGPVRPAAVGGRLDAGDHRPRQHRGQPRRRIRHPALPQQVHPGRDVRLARAADRLVSRRAEDRVDVLHLRRRPGTHLALHRLADGDDRRQALRHPLSRHAVRPHAALAPDRRFPRRVSRRARDRALRRLPVDVVRRHGAVRRGRRSSTCRFGKRRSSPYPFPPEAIRATIRRSARARRSPRSNGSLNGRATGRGRKR